MTSRAAPSGLQTIRARRCHPLGQQWDLGNPRQWASRLWTDGRPGNVGQEIPSDCIDHGPSGKGNLVSRRCSIDSRLNSSCTRCEAMSLPSARSPPASWRRGRHLDRRPSQFIQSWRPLSRCICSGQPGHLTWGFRGTPTSGPEHLSSSAVQQFGSSATPPRRGDCRGEGGTAALVLMHFFFTIPRGCGTCAR